MTEDTTLVSRLLADAVRREMRDVHETLRDVHDQVRRLSTRVDGGFVDLERRLLDVQEDIATTIKIEVTGRMAGFESHLETRLEEAVAQLDATYGTAASGDKPD